MKRAGSNRARGLATMIVTMIVRAGLICLAGFAALISDGGGARAQEAAAAPGTRAGTAEVAIVGGDSAGARARALDEALRQAVGQAVTDQVDPQTRAAAVKALSARARSFVKRYQIVQEGESNGSYSVRVDAEIDDVALRRAAGRWTTPVPAPAGAAARPAAPGALLVVVSGPVDAGPALVAALSAVGIKAQLGDASLTEPARALQAAAKASLSGVAFLSASITGDGIVRGPGQAAVSCRLAVKVMSVSGGRSPSDQTAAPRGFAEGEPAARADCLARAATAIAARLLPGAGAPVGPGGELRAVTLDADIVEPSVVAALLKTVRGLGSVSAAELRRVVPGRAEIRVRTRLAAPALGAALQREGSATITLANLEIAGDLIRLRARLRPPVPPPAPVTPGAPAPSASGPP